MADLMAPPTRSTTDIFGDPLDSEPLWFKKSSFLQPDFDPESYVTDLRTFIPLESLRSELRSHLTALKTELVDHLNRDYADFVSLSTRLVDIDAAVARMRAPLLELREKVAVVRGSIGSSLDALKTGLGQRAEASEAREVLELLLDAFHVVSKVEKLIKELPSIASGFSGTDTILAESGSAGNSTLLQHTESEANLRETQSILLERIASEINRLRFYTTHAQNLPFIENLEKRVQSAGSLLDSNLRHCFTAGLEKRDASAIYNCLRAYAAIENTAGAEEIFRIHVVYPLVQKVIGHGPSQVTGASSDDLEDDYQQIMKHIDIDCKFLLDISSSANSGLHVFDFLANSILKEVLSAIQMGKPGALSPGRPKEFLRNYKSSLDFLAYLEGYCPSKSAVAKFRSRGVYMDFMKLWNIGVYFSLRFQEIAGSLDSALTAAIITPVENLDDNMGNYHGLTLKQSITLLETLRSCWREDVLIFSCSDKFLRLSLQLLSRYSTWLSTGLAARKACSTGSTTTGSEWAITASPEDFIYVMHDLSFLAKELTGNYLSHILLLLETCPHKVQDLVERSYSHAESTLKSLIPGILDAIIEAIVEKSVEDLRQLKGMTATLRISNKPLPVRHSPYVAGLLRPLRAFLDGKHSSYLTNEARKQLVNAAAERITGRYYELASEQVNLARKTESSLQRLRQGAQRRTGATSDAPDSNISDPDRLCMQLFLDIQEYGRNLVSLGVVAVEIPAFTSLWQCVAPPERAAQISF